MNKPVLISVAISTVMIIGMIWFVSSKSDAELNTAGDSSTVRIVDGKQFIDISAKGGYSPRVILARAGMPTTLRVKTNGTLDCSASLVIPKLSYQKFLQSSGTEEISVSPGQAQGTLQGLCSMGMYNFQVRFQ